MADITPFRAVRYAGAAGSLADLVAPPYDAVDEDERTALYTRSPYNVAHITLPDSAGDAARLYREWLASGVLESEDEAAVWLAVENYVGPDGVARERHGVIASVAAAPYESGAVLPHELTHASVRDERLTLLRACRVQPEPILVLADSPSVLDVPTRPPEIEVGGTRLWRQPASTGVDVPAGQLLIADGHHRYESAVALGAELGVPVRIMALVVSTRDPGLRVFPTHRTFSAREDLASATEGEAYEDLETALTVLAAEPHDRSAAVAYRRGMVELIRGELDQLDVELVDRHGFDGIGYTPRADEAIAAVDAGSADVAFILRQPLVEDVFAAARNGRRMPQKSTYFHPKPLSGLLFHPVTP